MIGPKHT